MIDIHSHILPGIDDGARTIDESLEMLRLAAAAGTTDIVATPHASPQFTFDYARVNESFRDLVERSRSLISLHLGCDFHLSYENVSNALVNPTRYTINKKQYLMVELPDLVAVSVLRQPLRQLIEVGLVPIITHPERNLSLQRKTDELAHWIEDGCFVQVTGQSFLGRFGPTARAAADRLMVADLVHFVASDAHDCVDRTPDLTRAHKYISSRYGAERANAVCIYNPAAVISGESLSKLPQKRQSFFGFGKSRTA